MTSPYGDARLCASLTDEELEATFFYPGSPEVSRRPTGAAARADEAAREVCIECPVYLRCRAVCWGETYGVWGGTDQYERYVYRRKLARELADMGSAERAALAARMHHRALRTHPGEIARQTGYSPQALTILIAEHRDAVEALRDKRRAAAQAARDAVGVPALHTERRADGPRHRAEAA